MRKLSVIDLAMFLLETPERPFNIGPLIVLRPPKGARRFADRLLRAMLKHPPGAPFNLRLKLGLTHAPAVEPMPDADVQAHVHRLRLAGRATMEDLVAKVCELHAQALPRDGLLWQLYVIDGLAGGRVALYGKVHHGIIDGKSFVEVLTRWLSTDADDPEVRAMWQGLGHSSPARERLAKADPAWRRLWRTLGSAAQQSSALIGTGLQLSRMLAAQGRRSLGGGGESPGLPFVGVPRVLSGRPEARRSYAFTTLPLAQVKALGKAHGVTVNDILLVLLDLALERYLNGQPRRSRKPLVVDMPVALSGAQGGNQIAVLQLSMGSPGTGPIERLDAIRAETARLKAQVKGNASETLMLYTTLVHALPTVLELVGLHRRPLMVSNLLFSNPFGFAGKLYLMGAEVELALPISVVAAGQMLNVTVVTLADQLQLGFLALPRSVPQVQTLAGFVREALDQLQILTPAAAIEDAGKPRRQRPSRPQGMPRRARRATAATVA